MDFRQELRKCAETGGEYAIFNKRTVNTQKDVLGVRMGKVRNIAKGLVKERSVVDLEKLLHDMDKDVYEEVLVVGLAIGYAKISDAERIRLMRKWLPAVDSWALIDSMSTTIKKFDPELWRDFVVECVGSSKEYVVRFGVIFLMNHLLDDQGWALPVLRKVRHDGYYVKMGLAWTYAELALKDFDVAMTEMSNKKIDVWTRRKALTKMIESYRLTAEQKEQIRTLRSSL